MLPDSVGPVLGAVHYRDLAVEEQRLRPHASVVEHLDRAPLGESKAADLAAGQPIVRQ